MRRHFRRARTNPAGEVKQPFALDRMVLEGEQATLYTILGGPEGSPIEQGRTTVEAWTRRFVEAARGIPARTLGLIPQSLPLRALHVENNRIIFLVEYAPGVRTVAWTRGTRQEPSPGTAAREATVALPYVLFFITVHGSAYLGNSSVYFRSAPLQAADFSDPLCDCHFFNCSPRAHKVYCWICTGNLPAVVAQGQSLPDFVASVIDAFWFTGFNYSSEMHEGNSFFGLGRKGGKREIPDPRVQTIEAWEEATAADPRFALTVPWNPAGRTVRDVFYELATVDGGDRWPFRTASDLGNFVMNQGEKEAAEEEGAST